MCALNESGPLQCTHSVCHEQEVNRPGDVHLRDQVAYTLEHTNVQV